MVTIESRYVIERLSVKGLIWLQRMGVHGPVWTANKNKAQRFFRPSDAAKVVDAMPASLADQVQVVFADDSRASR